MLDEHDKGNSANIILVACCAFGALLGIILIIFVWKVHQARAEIEQSRFDKVTSVCQDCLHSFNHLK